MQLDQPFRQRQPKTEMTGVAPRDGIRGTAKGRDHGVPVLLRQTDAGVADDKARLAGIDLPRQQDVERPIGATTTPMFDRVAEHLKQGLLQQLRIHLQNQALDEGRHRRQP